MSKAKRLFATVALLVLGPFCIVMGGRELANSRKMLAHGQKVEAEVVDGYKHRRKSRTTYHLTVAFTAANGQKVQKSLRTSEADYEQGQATRRVAVTYLPEEPEVCAIGETAETKYGTLLGGVAMVFGGVFLAVTFRQPANNREGAVAIAKELEKLCLDHHEYAPADLNRFKSLDLAWYDASRQKMEGLGFAFLQDVENLTASRQNPGMKGFLRVHLGKSGTTIGSLYHLRPGFLLRLLGAKDLRVAEFETEFSNGHWVCTGNSACVGLLDSPPEMDVQELPTGTPIELVAQAHDNRVAKFLAQHPEAQPIQHGGIEEVLQAENRLQAIRGAFRRRHGVSKAELERLGGTTGKAVDTLQAEQKAKAA